MNVVISGKQMKVTDSLKAYVDEHLVQALTRFYDSEAAELRVELGNALPHKGGAHIECHLTFRMPGSRTLQIEAVTQDPYASIDGASERLVRCVKKELERMREPGGRRLEHPLANAPRD